MSASQSSLGRPRRAERQRTQADHPRKTVLRELRVLAGTERHVRGLERAQRVGLVADGRKAGRGRDGAERRQRHLGTLRVLRARRAGRRSWHRERWQRTGLNASAGGGRRGRAGIARHQNGDERRHNRDGDQGHAGPEPAPGTGTGRGPALLSRLGPSLRRRRRPARRLGWSVSRRRRRVGGRRPGVSARPRRRGRRGRRGRCRRRMGLRHLASRLCTGRRLPRLMAGRRRLGRLAHSAIVPQKAWS